MKTVFYCVLIAIFAAPMQISAQNNKVEEVKGRAERKAENRLDRRIDQGLDKGLDKLEGLFKRKKKKKNKNSGNGQADNNSSNNGNPNINLGGMFGKQKEVDLPNQYNFVADMTMEMKNYKKNPEKADVNKIKYLFPSTDKEYFGFEMAETADKNAPTYTSILQPEEMIVFMPMEGKKYYYVMDFESIAENIDTDNDNQEEVPEIKKTGKTKKILGYLCEEYFFEDEDMTGNYWITSELSEMGDQMTGVFFAMGQQFQNKKKKKKLERKDWPFPQKGMVLQMINYDKKSKETTESTAVEINPKKNSSFDPSPYQPMSIEAMMQDQ